MAALPHVLGDISNHFWTSPSVATSIYLYIYIADHAPQVKIWLIVKHENSFQTAEAMTFQG